MRDFDDFYAASYADLTVQVYAYFGDLHEAQDVVQEAFCRALARWRQVSGYDDPAAWVRRVAWNLATSRWRRLRVMRAFHRRQRGEPVVAGPEPDHVALVEAPHLATSERSATPPAAPSPSPSPSELPAEQLDRMAATAAAALGITSVDNKQRRREGKGPILMIGSEPARRGGISGTGYNENKTGVYVLDVLCVGVGTLRTRFWAATSGADEAGNPAPIPPDAAEARVPCSDEPERVSLSVRAPWPKKVYVSIEPDQAAEGRAAHASLVRVP